MAKNMIPSIIQAIAFVSLCMIVSALFGADITLTLVAICAIELVQFKILLRRYLDAYNNDEETEEEKK